MLGRSSLVSESLVSSPPQLASAEEVMRSGLPILDVTALLWNQPFRSLKEIHADERRAFLDRQAVIDRQREADRQAQIDSVNRWRDDMRQHYAEQNAQLQSKLQAISQHMLALQAEARMREDLETMIILASAV